MKSLANQHHTRCSLQYLAFIETFDTEQLFSCFKQKKIVPHSQAPIALREVAKNLLKQDIQQVIKCEEKIINMIINFLLTGKNIQELKNEFKNLSQNKDEQYVYEKFWLPIINMAQDYVTQLSLQTLKAEFLLPAKYRRLDSLARLLEHGMTCTAVCLTDDGTLLVTSNDLHARKLGKNEQSKGPEIEGVKYIIDFAKHLKDLADDKNEKLSKESEQERLETAIDLLYRNFVAKLPGLYKGSQKAPKIDESLIKTIIKYLLESESTRDWSKEDKYHGLIKNWLEDYTFSSEIEKIEKTKDALSFLLDLWRDVRAYRKVKDALQTSEENKTLDIKNIRILAVGSENEHAEIRLLGYVLFALEGVFEVKDDKLYVKKPLYFGISKPCCPDCHGSIWAFNELVQNQGCAIQENIEDDSENADEPVLYLNNKALYQYTRAMQTRGEHELYAKNWALPRYSCALQIKQKKKTGNHHQDNKINQKETVFIKDMNWWHGKIPPENETESGVLNIALLENEEMYGEVKLGQEEWCLDFSIDQIENFRCDRNENEEIEEIYSTEVIKHFSLHSGIYDYFQSESVFCCELPIWTSLNEINSKSVCALSHFKFEQFELLQSYVNNTYEVFGIRGEKLFEKLQTKHSDAYKELGFDHQEIDLICEILDKNSRADLVKLVLGKWKETWKAHWISCKKVGSYRERLSCLYTGKFCVKITEKSEIIKKSIENNQAGGDRKRNLHQETSESSVELQKKTKIENEKQAVTVASVLNEAGLLVDEKNDSSEVLSSMSPNPSPGNNGHDN